MYERLTVTDVARILRAAADAARGEMLERTTYTNDEWAAAKLLEWLAEGAEAVDAENQKALETSQQRNAATEQD